jgi:uncharacterized protein YajQ (UPF0234 family)|tara:strand:+ start:1014 stop:1511 length:498 start_codon:yes stop_codon:yes gene_type:complete
MAKSCSFDVMSVVDLAEVKNAVNQSMMEIKQRFDFKNSKSEITLEEKDNKLTLLSDDDVKLKAVIDILQSKLIKRGISIKALDYGKVEVASGNMVRQVVKIQQGIPQEKSKNIVRFLKSLKIKVQGQVIDDQVRVTGKSRDDLQSVMGDLKEKDFGIDMDFGNYR